MMVDESRVHEKWKENANLTYEQLFNPWWAYPHPGLFALIMKLDKELGREKTLQLIKETTTKLAKGDSKTKRIQSDDPETIIQELVKWTNMTSEMVQHLLEFEIFPSSPREYHLNVTKCLYAKSALEMGVPKELAYQWICYNDYVIAGILHPNIKLDRPKCLMLGDDRCEFHYTFEE
jgi:hypothetical protein